MRVGVIGVGKMGELHLQKYLGIPGVELVGIHDTNPERLAAVAERYRVKPYSDLQTFLFELDAASIASTTATHFQVGKQALESGVHVLVEKPVADTVARGEELVRIAHARKLILQVGLIERFRYLSLTADALQRPVRYIEAYRLSPSLARDRSADLVADLMIHDLDLALSLMKEDPVHVSAIGVPVLTNEFDMANVRLEFSSGAVVNLNVSRVSFEPVRKFRIFFSDAYASLDFLTNSVKVYTRTAQNKIELLRKDSHPADPLKDQIIHFLECARTGSSPLVTGEDGVRALKYAQLIAQKIVERLQMRRESANEGVSEKLEWD